MNVKNKEEPNVIKKLPVDAPFSEYFPTIYHYPKELDYFTEEIKRKYNLWRVDTALLKEQVPKPFELPDKFRSGKLIYVSLGTNFSVYTNRFQRLINIVDKVPFDIKYIVSKGQFKKL